MKHKKNAGNPARTLLGSGLAILLAWSSVLGSSLPAPHREGLPFHPRERLTFELRWGPVPAGEAVLETFPIQVINGIPSYHFVLTARSNPVLDMVFKVRDRIEGYADVGMTRSVRYKKDQKEGKTIRNVVVDFDWEKNHAVYTNFDRKEKPIPVLPGSFDPLSVFFYSRLLELKVDSEIQCPVTDGKKSIMAKAAVVGRETVTVPGGTFDTYVLEPELKDIGGVFEKSADAKIRLWVTADKRRIPVKIESKVIVGSFVGELISTNDH